MKDAEGNDIEAQLPAPTTMDTGHIALMKRLVAKHSLRWLQKELGTSRQTLAAAMAGMAIRRGSVHLLTSELSRLEKEGKEES
jgi:hypothetical protein